METLRKPFQGVKNIMRFNWHYYVLSFGIAFTFWALKFLNTPIHPHYLLLPAFVILLITVVSLLVSTYVYDISHLYSLQWMDNLSLVLPESIVNVNAGFDETSSLLAQKYPEADLTVLDFYDPKKHTEISIKRARKAYAPYRNTLDISTDSVPLEPKSISTIFAILSAHEIRDEKERILFFKQLGHALKENGSIIVTEHLRDVPNFLAYTIGFFHFHSKNTWLKTFREAKLNVVKEIKITPFLTTFELCNA